MKILERQQFIMFMRVLKDYLGVTVGVILTAFGLDAFLVPAKIAAGGVSGVATILHYIANLPVGAVMLALNIPLFIWSSIRLGWRSTVNSLYGMLTLSLFIDLLAPYVPLLTEDLLLASLYGGVFMGIGLGLVFRFNGTTGGTVLAAAIAKSYVNMNVGLLLFIIDAGVVVWAGLVFQSVELAMYALITIFLTSWIIDRVLEGFSTARAFIIVTGKADVVGQAINRDLDRGATAWKATGVYTGQEREVILSIVGITQVTRLKSIVREQDPSAFIMVAQVSEVLGQGFKGLEENK